MSILDKLNRPHQIAVLGETVYHKPISYTLARTLQNDAINVDEKAYRLILETLCDASGNRLYAPNTPVEEVLSLPVDFVSEFLEKAIDGTSPAKESTNFVKQ